DRVVAQRLDRRLAPGHRSQPAPALLQALKLLWLSSGRDLLVWDRSWWGLEKLEEPAGEIALQASFDLSRGLALGGAAGGGGPGWGGGGQCATPQCAVGGVR